MDFFYVFRLISPFVETVPFSSSKKRKLMLFFLSLLISFAGFRYSPIVFSAPNNLEPHLGTPLSDYTRLARAKKKNMNFLFFDDEKGTVSTKGEIRRKT